MAELFQYIIWAFDGPAGWAKRLFADYLQSPSGSAVQQKYHGMILKLSKDVSDSGAAQKSYNEMTDDELETEFTKTAATILKLGHDTEGRHTETGASSSSQRLSG